MPVVERIVCRCFSNAVDTCIVYRHIQSTAFFNSEIDQVFHSCRISDIDRKVVGPASLRAYFGGFAVRSLGIKELTFQTQNIDVETFRGFEAATAVTLIYLALALSIAGIMTMLERRILWR